MLRDFLSRMLMDEEPGAGGGGLVDDPPKDDPPKDDPPKDDPPKDDPPKDDPPKDDPPKDDDDTGAPEAYEDFTMPEGVELDKETLEAATPLFKELKLNQEQAQKLVDFQAAQQEKQIEAFNQQKTDWLSAAKTDKEIGGDQFDEHVSDARVALEKIGSPELKQFLNETGAGNHPEIIRAFSRVGKLMKEDSPGNGGTPPGKSADRVELLYGDSE